MQINQKKISDQKLKDKAGGLANESRFGLEYDERERRQHKVLTVPAVNADSALKVEQAWNKRAARARVVKLTIADRQIIVSLDDWEQALAYMSQGDELLKFVQPTIRSNN